MNLLTMISGKGELWSIPKASLINFERMQEIIKMNNSLIINTLKDDMQHCLLKHTIHAKEEVKRVEKGLKTSQPCVIYGMHHYDATLVRKYQQLKNLGAEVILVYGGGMFEWLLLQDIYGNEEFPTSGRELDLLKYKPNC